MRRGIRSVATDTVDEIPPLRPGETRDSGRNDILFRNGAPHPNTTVIPVSDSTVVTLGFRSPIDFIGTGGITAAVGDGASPYNHGVIPSVSRGISSAVKRATHVAQVQAPCHRHGTEGSVGGRTGCPVVPLQASRSRAARRDGNVYPRSSA